MTAWHGPSAPSTWRERRSFSDRRRYAAYRTGMTGQRTRGSDGERSPIMAAVLSALLPGAGQWYGGRRVRGLVFAAPLAASLFVVAVGALTGAIGPRSMLTWAVQPHLLRLSLIPTDAILISS